MADGDRFNIRNLTRAPDLSKGEDPDYRFTLANERTFLAWVRTALALVAGGLAAIHLIPDALGSEVLGLLLLGLAFLTAVSSYVRWSRIENALRANQTLPHSRIPQIIAYSVALVAVVTAGLFIIQVLIE
jgi:putative membrane protein